jgi:hypothetical protein
MTLEGMTIDFVSLQDGWAWGGDEPYRHRRTSLDPGQWVVGATSWASRRPSHTSALISSAEPAK